MYTHSNAAATAAAAVAAAAATTIVYTPVARVLHVNYC